MGQNGSGLLSGRRATFRQHLLNVAPLPTHAAPLPVAPHPTRQDPHRVPQWYQKFMLQYQSLAGVYIIEDRFQGARCAVLCCVVLCCAVRVVPVCPCCFRGQLALRACYVVFAC